MLKTLSALTKGDGTQEKNEKRGALWDSKSNTMQHCRIFNRLHHTYAKSTKVWGKTPRRRMV